MRIGTVLMAFGIVFSGSSASEAVTPMISVPPKAKSTRMRADSTPVKPFGNNPPSFHRFEMPTVPPVSTLNTRMAAPPRIMATTAVTLIVVNQNSSSPNQRAEARFAAPTLINATATHADPRPSDPSPGGGLRKPELQVRRHGREVGQAHDDHLEGVHPAGDVPGPSAQVAAAILREGPSNGVSHGHLAQGAQHEVDDRAAEQINEDHAGAGRADRAGGTVEQPGADGRTQRDEVDVPVAQRAPQLTLVAVSRRGFARRGGLGRW